jgi:hypothetical protein
LLGRMWRSSIPITAYQVVNSQGQLGLVVHQERVTLARVLIARWFAIILICCADWKQDDLSAS